MAKSYDLLYLDSCVVIDLLAKTPSQIGHLEPILLEAEKENIQFVVSVLCLAEVYTLADMPFSEAYSLIRDFFAQEYVNVYNVDEKIALQAAELRKKSKLETADALHLATALRHHAQAFLTRDGEGKKGKKRRKETILELRDELADRIDILTPKEFFESLSSDARQTTMPDEIADESEAETNESE